MSDGDVATAGTTCWLGGIVVSNVLPNLPFSVLPVLLIALFADKVE